MNNGEKMKKTKLKSILGAALILTAITNTQAETTKKIKKSKTVSVITFKVEDRTNDHGTLSDGSKTERASK